MISFEHVSKRFDDGTLAVDDFSLTIPSRSTTVFVGSSGCGKTTLLRMINRMVDPSEGRIVIDDEVVSDVDPVRLRRRIGYVMQNSGLLPHRTVIDNVATVPMLTGVNKKQARADALTLLDTVGLDRALADRYPSQLSGGQQQRVGVARGLAIDPNILLMDEPFGAVDPLVRAELQQELLRLQRDIAKTIVFVTHDIDEAFLLGDQVVILQKGGHIAQVGTPAEILGQPGRRLRRPVHRRGSWPADAARRTRRRTRRRRGRGRPPRRCPRSRPGFRRPTGSGRPAERRIHMSWVIANWDMIWGLTLTHVQLSLPPIVLGFLISLPLGWLAHRYRWSRGVLLTLSGILYAIPSLPLFVLMPSLIGTKILDPANVVVALTIYAVALLVRTIADALDAVDAGVRQSARPWGSPPASGSGGSSSRWRARSCSPASGWSPRVPSAC